MSKLDYIHFVGIKGVGMAPLAIIAKEAGMRVSGSDIKDKFITDELLSMAGIKPDVGFSKTHIKSPNLVVTTGAHGGFENIEVIEAKKKKIKVIAQGEAVGLFMDGGIFGKKFIGISVTGTHGKTTTTAMIATILRENSLDPSFLVGTGFIPSLGTSGHFGSGKYFVSEADEYMTEPRYDKTIKFMWQNPKVAVITNIEFDHPDAYKTIEDVRIACEKFAQKLGSNGTLVTSKDSPQVNILLKSYAGKVFTYGVSPENDFVVKNIKFREGKTSFQIDSFGKKTSLKLNVFGQHNAINAAGSFVVGLTLGLSPFNIKKGLLAFRGTKRRSEFVGILKSGAKLFDDYAHHPTEIRSTLRAFRQNFPKSKIVCIFQPHTYSRTKSLFDQFSKSFIDVDDLILTNIFSSLREKKDPSVSSELLAKETAKFTKNVVHFLPELSSVVEYINEQEYGKDTIVITMGAGDVYKINEKLKLR
ncbi:MAG: UDP-N-acetylmuramate--L-alanine ligase [Patescibacteria group bacterium]